MPDLCYWQRQELGDSWYFNTTCGNSVDDYDTNCWKFCPFCGKNIDVYL